MLYGGFWEAQGLWGDFLLCAAPTQPQHFSISLHMNILARQGDVIAPILQTGSTGDFFPGSKWLKWVELFQRDVKK